MSPVFRKFLFLCLVSIVGFFGQTAAVSALNVVELLPDPTRPRLFAVNNNGKTADGSILVIDTLTHATIAEIPVGKEPTDIDLTENSAELLVMNTTDRSISRIDLATLAVTTTYVLTEFDDRNNDFGGHVVDGPGNIVYYVDEQWGPRLRVYDTSTGTVLQTFGATTVGTENDYGFGDIAVNPDKTALFGWVQYGDGAGWAGSYVVRYDIAADGTLAKVNTGDSNYPTALKREPFNSKVLLSADGTMLVIKDRRVNQSSLDDFPAVYPDTIYSMSPSGKIVATSKAILPATGGEILHSLPVTATVQTILPDYSAMVYFNPTTKAIAWLDLVTTVGPQAMGLHIEPADGAVVSRPTQLGWFPSTGIYRYQVYLSLVRSTVEGATSASPSYLGETSSTSLPLSLSLSSGQTYFWKVVPVGHDGLASGPGVIRSFRVSDVSFSRSAISAETVQGVTGHVETISLESTLPQTWSATANVSWITFRNSTGTTPGNLVVVMNAAALNPGIHTANITWTTPTDSFVIPVSLRVYATNYTISKADLELPYVYVVSQENNTSSQPSFLLRIDTATDSIESAISCGRSVTDMVVHYQENRIYVTNWQTGILRAFDRTTFQQVQTYQYAPVNSGTGALWRVAAGKQGRLIIEESNQWIVMRLIDTADGAVIATNNTEYAGDGEADPTGQYYYHAGLSSIKRFDLSADTFALMTPLGVPQGTTVVIGDGSIVTGGSRVFDAELAVQFTVPGTIVAGTLHNELLFTESRIFNGVNGLEMTSLPISTPVMSVTGDQKKLYLFPSNSKTFRTVDLSSIASLPARDVTPSIANAATVIGLDQELGWSVEPFAASYRVYFGTSQYAVTNATPGSSEDLGSSLTNSWTGNLPTLDFAQTYYWRVDAAGFSGTRKGSTWSFRVAPLDVTPRSVDIISPTSAPVPVQRLALTDPGTGSFPWTATTTTPWIKLLATSGSASGHLDFEIKTTGLTIGQKEGSITFHAGGDTFTVPVKLRMVALNITKLLTHPARPFVYGIHTAATGDGPSLLMEIDAATAAILRSIPIGSGTTDAALDAVNDRLYVTNFGSESARVIDIQNWMELPPLALGTDVSRLGATSGGRLVTMTQTQGTNLGLWDSSTGVKLSSQSVVNGGDGEFDPTGMYYYYADGYSSFARISKYDISADSFVSSATSPVILYGSPNLIVSGDGSKLFWQSRVLDSDLNILGQMPDEVYATNLTGELAIGQSQIWWSDSATPLAPLPFGSTVVTVSSDDTYLVRFDGSAKTLHSIAISSLTDLPGPSPRPGEAVDASPERLSWSPVVGAISYRVFIAQDAATLAAMTSPVATVTTTYYNLPSPLVFGRSYTWRVDAVIVGGGVTLGNVQSFGVRFPDGPVVPAVVGGTQGAVAASMSGGHLLVGGSGFAQLYGFDAAAGSVNPLQAFSLPGYYNDHLFGNSVALDADKAAVGASSYDTPVSNAGAAFVYHQDGKGVWKNGGPLSLPNPLAEETFAKGMAASGNMVLAGTNYVYNKTGRVAAYVTEPETTRVQTFSARDGKSGDGFGQVIAMEGNLAIIAAPGRGESYNRVACLYAFSRSTTSGQWAQTQKIEIPGAAAFSNVGTVLALAGNFFATNNNATGSVEIFTRNGAGQWAASASIKRSDSAGSSGSFGNSLAIVGDQLFVGDPSASYAGKSGGAVFSFRRSGTTWVAGPVITPRSERYNDFGNALAARDGWLLATSSSPQPGWLFRVDAEANQIPRFTGDIPSQLVVGRAFSAEIHADDTDGNDGLVFDILQGPLWLQLADRGNGKATLSGLPTGAADSVQTVQLRVRDAAGAQALYTYQLSLLAATSVPVLTLEPTGGEVGEGQEITLHAVATGIGPFKWQWFRDGKPIPGANDNTLIFEEIGLADAGTYSVSVANAVGSDESAATAITVNPATRDGGDWPTFGGSPRHAGFHPARLGVHYFAPAWTRQIHPTNALNRVAVAEGRVFANAASGFEASSSIHALDFETGDPVWIQSVSSSYSINPPTWHNGTVYFQRGKGTNDPTGPQLIALDATTGERRWASVFGAQWESYEAPAVTDDGIWINGGTYGGMYGFNLDGTQTFFRSLAQVDGWTPTIANGHLYSWVGGDFQEHNPDDGTTIWMLSTGLGSSRPTSVSAVSGNSAAISRPTGLVCIDLPTRSIRWRKDGNFIGSPAISAGSIYAIQDKKVVSFSLADGTEGLVTAFPEAIVSAQPLLVMDYLFVASANNTYVVDRATSTIVRTLPGGGKLSFAGSHLFAAGIDGTLRAWFAGPVLHFTSEPNVAANDRADDSEVDLAEILYVPHGIESLEWTITGNSNPGLFSNVGLNESGLLQLSFTPYISGSAVVTVEVTGDGMTATTQVQVSLPALPEPEMTLHSDTRYSRANGLYEQTVTVKNVAARAIGGFEVIVSDLAPGVVFYNATTQTAGGGVLVYKRPLAAGESVTLALHYYDPTRRAIPQPQATVTLGATVAIGVVDSAGTTNSVVVSWPPGATPEEIAQWIAGMQNNGRPPAQPFVILNFQMRSGRAPSLEFPTQIGQSYRVQYSENLTDWKSCPTMLVGTGNVLSWSDTGPPMTDCSPSDSPTRFYRVQRIEP